MAFNQSVSFDTSSVTDMYGMFLSASAFDQPLSFDDTSSVTDMRYMFNVRSSPCPAPSPSVASSACAPPCARRSPILHLWPHIACPAFDSAGGDGF